MRIRFGPVHRMHQSTLDVNGFIKVYREAFGGEPYFEEYTDDEIRAIWDEHLADGRIILAKDEEDAGRVVGLGCSLPLHHAHEDVQEFLASCMAEGLLPADFTFQNAWYMSELGVLAAYRNQNIAYELVRHRLLDVSHMGAKYYIMRTAADKPSNSRHLYERLGGKPIDKLHDVSDTAQVTENVSQSEMRVYLFGESREAMHNLSARLTEKGHVLSEYVEPPDESGGPEAA